MKKYSYFTEDEMRCKCGCGTLIVQPLHFFRMNLLRHAINSPLTPSSWCRCPDHNQAVGGKDTSSHPEGWATDIVTFTLLFQVKIIFYAGVIGFHGIGVGDTFVHLDNDLIKGANRF